MANPGAVIEAAVGGVILAGMNTAAVVAGGPAVALDLLPVSAGISGAVLAGLQSLRPSAPGQLVNRDAWYHAISTVLSGAAAAVFVVPAVCEWAELDSLRTVVFAHLVGGLTGSTLVDQILARRAELVAWIVKRWSPDRLPVPPAPSPPDPEPARPPGVLTDRTQ